MVAAFVMASLVFLVVDVVVLEPRDAVFLLVVGAVVVASGVQSVPVLAFALVRVVLPLVAVGAVISFSPLAAGTSFFSMLRALPVLLVDLVPDFPVVSRPEVVSETLLAVLSVVGAGVAVAVV